jgi:hypothetical protein
MPQWDDPRGPRYEGERDRWRREGPRERHRWEDGERRAFGEDQGRWGGRGDEAYGIEPGRRERHAGRRQRADYGYEDAGDAGWRRHGMREHAARFGDTSPMHGGEPYAYGGQEYGLEGHPSEMGGGPPGPDWRFELDERRANFDWDDPGVGQSQAGYGAQARSHPDDEHPPRPDELEPDYVRWRDEQLRVHDRDYQDWRREQHQKYDEQYRQFRSERQRRFGQAFHEWRAQRSAAGAIPGGGQGGQGETAVPGGYNSPSPVATPSGFLDPPGPLSADSAVGRGGGGDPAPELGKEPPQVRATSKG